MAPAPDHRELLTDLLHQVSRSFYLTLRVLPAAIRPQVGLAYLLARTTDTIADTEVLPPEKRLRALEQLRRRVLGEDTAAFEFSEFVRTQASAAERRLLERIEESLALLAGTAPADRALIREVLRTITGGQSLDLQRFAAAAAPDRVVALETATELDDYTYRVAGCVGEFWTRICLNHLPHGSLDTGFLLQKGVRLGQGLQLVNILRDLPCDVRQGRCYLPAPALRQLGLEPRDLLRSEVESRLRPLYNQYLDIVLGHLEAGWDYTTHLPQDWRRVRLACAWPILIAVRTLRRLRHAPILDAAHPVKAPRREVRSIVFRTVWRLPWPSWWERLFAEETACSAGRRRREEIPV